MSERLPGDGDVALFVEDSESWLDGVGFGHALARLDDLERDRGGRFHRESDRRTYVASHAMLRTVLAHALDLEPAALRFERTEHGKPELSFPSDTGLFFNLSHSAGCVALAVSRDRACGIDVERVDRAVDPVELAPQVFTERERAWMHSGRGELERRSRFFRLWTVKEAYSKARGLGLALGFTDYGFDLSGEVPRLVESPSEVDPVGWHVQEVRVESDLALAWAAERNSLGSTPRESRWSLRDPLLPIRTPA